MFLNCLMQDGECRCACHKDPCVVHIVACCDKPPASVEYHARDLCPCDDPGGPDCLYPGAGR